MIAPGEIIKRAGYSEAAGNVRYSKPRQLQSHLVGIKRRKDRVGTALNNQITCKRVCVPIDRAARAKICPISIVGSEFRERYERRSQLHNRSRIECDISVVLGDGTRLIECFNEYALVGKALAARFDCAFEF